MSCDVRLLRRAFQLGGQVPLSQTDAEHLAAALCVDNEVFPHLLLKRGAFEGSETLKFALAEVVAAAPSTTATRNDPLRNRIAEDAGAVAIASEMAAAVMIGVTMRQKDQLIAKAQGTKRTPRDSDPSAPERWIGF